MKLFATVTTYIVAVASSDYHGTNVVTATSRLDEHQSPQARSSLRYGKNQHRERELVPGNGRGPAKKQSNPCLVLIQATEYDGEAEGAEETLSCMLDEGDSTDEPKGNGKRIVKLSGMTVDEFESQGYESGNALLSSGDDGELYDDELKVKPGKFQVEKKALGKGGGKGVGFQRGRRMAGRTTSGSGYLSHRELLMSGSFKTLVVRVVAPDAQTTANAATLSNKVFGTSGDEVNLRTWYDKCSQGQMDFFPASSADDVTITDGGVTEVTISTAVSGVSDGTVRSAVEGALNNQIPNWRTQFDHTMLCLPPGTTGNWIGYAWIGHYESVYNDNWCTYPSIQMHEIGHNLGLGHSGEFSRDTSPQMYQDQSGMMGYSYSNDSTKMCFNGAKMWYFGWYSPHTIEIDPVVTTVWNGDLVGPATYSAKENEWVVVKIETDPSGPQCRTCYDFYVAFNRQTDFNSGTKEGQNRVLITEQGDGQTNAKSLILAKLTTGESYVINDFGGRIGETVTVIVNNIDLTTSLASVSIQHSSACLNDADCDDGDDCNGSETCNSGLCLAGTPVLCDDNDACNGLETCNPVDGTCIAGTPVQCDNGDVCDGLETCDSLTGDCLSGTPPTIDDGLYCNGIETCDPVLGIVPGTAPDCEAESDFCTGMKECSDEAGACVVVNPMVCEVDGDVCNGVDYCDPIAEACVAGEELTCDDNDVCNGVESCDPVLGCVDGEPLECGNNDVCDGEEYCDSAQGCMPGTPLSCDDGLVCNGLETCDPITGCKAGTHINCDDGNYCNGVETCVEAPESADGYMCMPGTEVTCPGSTECNPLICDNAASSCIVDEVNKPETCCGDGVCNGLETCADCPEDCISGTISGNPSCGNGICENGETCNNCSSDCPGRQNGPTSGRYCCAGGPNGDCNANQCGGPETCNPSAVGSDVTFCCGDGVCDSTLNLGENSENCSKDCSGINGPTCGDGICENGETLTDCPSDCCMQKGNQCNVGSDCCSNWCKNNGTCG